MSRPSLNNWGLKLLALLLAILLYYALKTDAPKFSLNHDQPTRNIR